MSNGFDENFQNFLSQVQGKIEDYKCPKCGNSIFEMKLVLGRVSPIVSPTGEEMIFPVGSITVCSRCGFAIGSDVQQKENPVVTEETPKEENSIIQFDSFKKKD